MRAGVTIVDPASTRIDAGITIGQDTTIEPGTSIKGATTIGERCSIKCSYVDGATIEDGVSVGPFAYLRPGAHLRSNSKAGTFVEIKNSDIGEGTKVPHLSYIGDADVGPDSNLGAATITANYDSKSKTKSRTTIGAGVKTGGGHDARRAGVARRRRLHCRGVGRHPGRPGPCARRRACAAAQRRGLRGPREEKDRDIR